MRRKVKIETEIIYTRDRPAEVFLKSNQNIGKTMRPTRKEKHKIYLLRVHGTIESGIYLCSLAFPPSKVGS